MIRGRSWYEKQAKSDLAAEDPEGEKSVVGGNKGRRCKGLSCMRGKIGMMMEKFPSSLMCLCSFPGICGDLTKSFHLINGVISRDIISSFIFSYLLPGHIFPLVLYVSNPLDSIRGRDSYHASMDLGSFRISPQSRSGRFTS